MPTSRTWSVAGRLVGYAGRVIDDALITEENPRYRFPCGREKQGVHYDFQKKLFLYNGFAVRSGAAKAALPHVVVVESFTATWWCWQSGIPDVVALMGSSCSAEQAALILATAAEGGVVSILTDGDDAGTRCAISLFAQLAPHRLVRWAKLGAGRQPTDCSPEVLTRLLAS